MQDRREYEMTVETKQFLRSVCVKGGVRQIARRNEMFQRGFFYMTDAWCGHDCVVGDRRTGKPVAWRDGRKVTFA